ncbi:hypothetical protein VCR4J5_170160 [Vibrio crassostreae]|uniref:Uncharacterized protein n=1 Tax=Vibrio crassostreae TaxID=246167 RepID=A0ABP1WUG5_9VIBR|nr:hypothetical protein VCRA2119O47_140035 [Vibrio crassostreae]CAK1768432.1 hypothetical protein VCRA2119O44_140104 [Vibrio crassostreae]CAK1812749.1 hypothetical protein VCRA2110O113_170039 [Vibrio crassostreae]CAK2161984.1 hypothetical protein VCRA2117O379_60102 [Vibrio crassostreae]CAK2172360.1 hypothetical protein VCRA2119O382_60188 [Vibrio crassostreae]
MSCHTGSFKIIQILLKNQTNKLVCSDTILGNVKYQTIFTQKNFIYTFDFTTIKKNDDRVFR